jgi:hypothetical protein
MTTCVSMHIDEIDLALCEILFPASQAPSAHPD